VHTFDASSALNLILSYKFGVVTFPLCGKPVVRGYLHTRP